MLCICALHFLKPFHVSHGQWDKSRDHLFHAYNKRLESVVKVLLANPFMSFKYCINKHTETV